MPDNRGFDAPDEFMDEADIAWVNQFLECNGGKIPDGSVIDGFISIISWTDPDGNMQWRSYNTLNRPLSMILGLLTMCGHSMMMDNTQRIED